MTGFHLAFKIVTRLLLDYQTKCWSNICPLTNAAVLKGTANSMLMFQGTHALIYTQNIVEDDVFWALHDCILRWEHVWSSTSAPSTPPVGSVLFFLNESVSALHTLSPLPCLSPIIKNKWTGVPQWHHHIWIQFYTAITKYGCHSIPQYKRTCLMLNIPETIGAGFNFMQLTINNIITV